MLEQRVDAAVDHLALAVAQLLDDGARRLILFVLLCCCCGAGRGVRGVGEVNKKKGVCLLERVDTVLERVHTVPSRMSRVPPSHPIHPHPSHRKIYRKKETLTHLFRAERAVVARDEHAGHGVGELLLNLLQEVGVHVDRPVLIHRRQLYVQGQVERGTGQLWLSKTGNFSCAILLRAANARWHARGGAWPRV